jgi:predicted Zn-dependent peptidase
VADEEVRSFHKHRYGPEWSALVVAGAFDVDEVLESARRSFGDWRTNTSSRLGPRPEPTVLDSTKGWISGLDRRRDSTLMMLGLPCVGVGSADSLVFDIVATILAESADSRWYRQLRQEHGTTYGIDAHCDGRANAGEFLIVFDVKNDRVGAALDSVFAELNDLAKVPVSSSELALAQRAWGAIVGDRVGTNQGAADSLGLAFLAGLPPTHYSTLVERLAAVTPADVQRVVQRYFKPELMRLAVIGDAPAVHDQLSRFGTVMWR